jgi:hypothetical protein
MRRETRGTWAGIRLPLPESAERAGRWSERRVVENSGGGGDGDGWRGLAVAASERVACGGKQAGEEDDCVSLTVRLVRKGLVARGPLPGSRAHLAYSDR